jgi:hypothetical protein
MIKVRLAVFETLRSNMDKNENRLQRKALGSAGAVSGASISIPSALSWPPSTAWADVRRGRTVGQVDDQLVISRSRWANGRGRACCGSAPKGLARSPEGSRSNYYRRYGKSRNSRRDTAQSHTDGMPRLARDTRWDRIHRLLLQAASLPMSILRPLRLSGRAKKCS